MSEFQAFAVRGISGPVVTLQAGVDFGGYYWTTTSGRAAKVAALRRDSIASVLSRKDESWRLRAGRAVVIDVSRAPEGVRELPVFALAGSALALIAVRYPEQLLGYVADAASTPKAWRLHHRVLIAVRHEEELAWTDDGVMRHRTDRFRHDPEARTRFGLNRPGGDRQVTANLMDPRSTSTATAGWGSTPTPGPSSCQVIGDAGPRLSTCPRRCSLPSMHVCPAAHASRSTTATQHVRPANLGSSRDGIASLSRSRGAVASIVVEVDSTTTWNGFRSQGAAA